ncbi:PTS sugar transporter subunit IIA [Pseudoleptotrichia goodfellowii]|uniref:Ascorbate-specific PTS system EIIA component n=1 Tax=Pseudoleptotrichia goodfellowii TaxID=157692 RepID=A0A510J8G4_9FUSO|nr:PTS sugar transporter subunit IIA [Pseudoleptotrichia goodfellowii]BBM35600.1 PTS transporter subunit IIA-like nitrogen-regulatory protein PtsN [Pseudoleptotrichia goodfellowii]
MLEEILDGNIQTVDFVKDWEESIKIASKPLLEKKIIEEKYVEAMIESIKKLGFYIILRENLAMPHARPEEGAIDTGISLLKLNQPVNYGDEKVYLVIVLASKDSDSHTEILMKLVELFQDDESIEELIKAETVEEIRRIVGKY